ncbi:unnamed protein product [Closterium sp. Naga37s-1]|nr:unnamed protein product [Closterium sp. Naga37s-1]
MRLDPRKTYFLFLHSLHNLYPRLFFSSCTMAEQIYNSDLTMSAAEEEALVASGEDLLVDDLSEGLIDHLADSAELPVAKKPCFDAGASHTPSSPSTNITASPESAQAHQSRSPAPPAAAASGVSPSGPSPSQTATTNAPNAPAGCAAAYASVASGSNPSLGLPASPIASPFPGTPPPPPPPQPSPRASDCRFALAAPSAPPRGCFPPHP